MPSQKQEFSFAGQTSEQLLLLAYGTLLDLHWTPKYAGPVAIVAYTPRSWNKYDDEILIEAAEGSLTVTSSLVHNESFDMRGKNKKHIKDFIAAFEKVKEGGVRQEWIDAITQLRRQTISAVNEQTKNTVEVDSVIKMSTGNLYVTYSIIGINIIVFLAMVVSGVNLFAPTNIDVLEWGANYAPLTLTGDWWRLLTSTFVHVGIIHIAFNMYALYMVGLYLEPMLGKIKFSAAYLSSGIVASIGSLIWHRDPVPSAGASGAIFGMYGVFLALLLTNLIPKQIRMSLLQSIGIFVVFNLVFGMQAGIDNAAHIGGLISGMLIGFIYYFSLKKQEDGSKRNLSAVVIALVTIGATWFYLDQAGDTLSPATRQQIQNEIKEVSAKDGIIFFEKLNKFYEIDSKCVETINNKTVSETELIKNINNLMPEWDKAAAIVEEMKRLEVSDLSKRKIKLLEGYTGARKEEAVAYVAYLTDKKPENMLRLSEIREKVTKVINEINELK